MSHLAEKAAGRRRRELAALLQRAYSDEWFAHYNYWLVAGTISGPASPALSAVIHRKAVRALERAHLLAARLRQLGSDPPAKLMDLAEHATDKPFKLPKDQRDTDGILRAVLDAERTSLRTYEEILKRTEGSDPVTAKRIVEFLSEAMEGEEELQRLLGRPAPEMTGR